MSWWSVSRLVEGKYMRQDPRHSVPVFAFAVLLTQAAPLPAQSVNQRAILIGADPAEGFNLGVDTSGQVRIWAIKEPGQLKLAYPAGQAWGAAFFTPGPAVDPPRPFTDFSRFEELVIEMRGETAGTRVEVGIKTNTQPDNGRETKIPVTLSASWQTYTFKLDRFAGADTTRLYVVTEFVFAGAVA
jgi:hypothetical protein